MGKGVERFKRMCDDDSMEINDLSSCTHFTSVYISCQGKSSKQTVCRNTKCKHNVLFKNIFSEPINGQQNQLTPHETDVSRSFLNCMLCLDRDLTLEELGELYGCSYETIRRIIARAIKKIKKDPLCSTLR